LLDRLQQQDGLTLGQLCEGLAMTRQAVSRHLAQLEAANLIVTVWRGREKVHHLNPVPIGEIYDRWIGRYEQHRVSALIDLKQALEASPMSDTFAYSIFIDSSPERIWQALTDGAFSRQFWAGRKVVSDWAIGSPVHIYVEDTDTFEVSGEVLAAEPNKRLSYTWNSKGLGDHPTSTVVFELQPWGESVQLTVTHGPLPANSMARNGWVAIMSSLKSFLETGQPLAATKLWPRNAA
jgi:uncharacterized protein YndB with AHSA1/START domain